METAMQTVGCVEAATNILGDKWTPHLLRYFLNEKVVRFCQLQDLTGGINPRTLFVERVIPGSSSRCEYQLTQKGQDLLPILLDMQKWGEKYDLANS
jgi:DNA-binding HxlR family transcriptional regulator